MAVGGGQQSFIAPGVYSKEIDLSQIPAAAQLLGATFIGVTTKGKAFVPRRLNNFGEFRSIFGGYNITDTYVPYAVDNYFRGGGPVATVVRVLGRGNPSNGFTTDYGQAFVLGFPTSGTASLTGTALSSYTAQSTTLNVLAVLRTRPNSGITTVGMTGTPSNFNLNIGGTVINGLSLDRTQKTYIGTKLGKNKKFPNGGDAITGIYVDTILDYRYQTFINSYTIGSVPGSSDNPATALSNYTTGLEFITGGYSPASTPAIVSQPYFNTATGANATATVYPLFKLHLRTDGEASNRNVKISISDIQTVSDNPSDPNTALKFTVNIRDFSDLDRNPVILEQFRVNLDPNSTYFISNVIGDEYPVTTIQTPGGTPVTTHNGSFPNKSAYVYVEIFPGYPFDVRPEGFQGTNAIRFLTTKDVDWPLKSDNLDQTGTPSQRVFPGFFYESTSAIGFSDYIQGSFSTVDGATQSKGFLMLAVTGESSAYTGSVSSNINNSLTSSYYILDMVTTANSNIVNGLNQFTVPVFGGSDGISPWKNLIEAINDGTLSAELLSALATVANPEQIDTNLLAVPGVHAGASQYNGQFTNNAILTCETRGDCFYVMDNGKAVQGTTGALDSSVTDVVGTVQGYDTNYAATYYPWIRILDTDVNRMVWVPPSVLVPMVYAYNDKVAQPWFAPAGMTRGTLQTVIEARIPLALQTRETLYAGKVNPIKTLVNFPIYIDGQKTLQALPTALDRINVRRLLIYVKKVIAGLAYQFQYLNNTPKLRQQLVDVIEPKLQDILIKQGITAFQVIIDDTNNTPDTIDRNVLNGTIIITPARSVEIINLGYVVTRTGANFTEIVQQLNS